MFLIVFRDFVLRFENFVKVVLKLFLSVRKLLRLKKSVRTDPVYRIINQKCVKRCVAPTLNNNEPETINGDGATHLKECFYYISINGVSPNGLYRQQQLSYTKNYFLCPTHRPKITKAVPTKV